MTDMEGQLRDLARIAETFSPQHVEALTAAADAVAGMAAKSARIRQALADLDPSGSDEQERAGDSP